VAILCPQGARVYRRRPARAVWSDPADVRPRRRWPPVVRTRDHTRHAAHPRHTAARR